MDYEFIKVTDKYDGEVADVVMGPAPANIVSAKLMEEVSHFLKEEEKNNNRKLIVFSGEGKHFSFGASVEEHKPELVNDMLPGFHKMIGAIIDCSIPTLAKVSGLCLGGGFEVALACTFIFADEKAKFGVPEIQLAVFPPVACALLPFKCGDAFSSQIILTGENFSAKELYDRNIINEVVETGKLDETVTAFFEKQFQPKSASSLSMARKASGMVLSRQYNEYINDLEKLYLKDLMATNDAKEGIGAFLEKRKPQFKNC